MKTRNITKHPDFNCWQHESDGVAYLLGGRYGESEHQRIRLPHYVRLVGSDRKLIYDPCLPS